MEISSKTEIDGLLPRLKEPSTIHGMKAVLRNIHISADKLRADEIVTASGVLEEFKKLFQACSLYLKGLDKALVTTVDSEKKEVRRVRQRMDTLVKQIQKAHHDFVERDKATRIGSKNYNEAVKKALALLLKNGAILEKVVETEKSFSMKSADGSFGYRLEFDQNYGAHLNVFFPGKKASEHFTFPGNENSVKALFKQLRTLPKK